MRRAYSLTNKFGFGRFTFPWNLFEHEQISGDFSIPSSLNTLSHSVMRYTCPACQPCPTRHWVCLTGKAGVARLTFFCRGFLHRNRNSRAVRCAANFSQDAPIVRSGHSNQMSTTTSNTGASPPPPITSANAQASNAPRSATHDLPDEPVVTIRPRRAWEFPDFSEIWSHRELLYFLTWRDIKVRYKQTLLGVTWVIIQPVATMLIFTLLFGRLAGLDQRTGGVPYPIFAFTGLLPWTFFATAVAASSNSLVGSAHLISKVYFPRLIIPAATIGAGLVDFGLSFAVFVAMMAYYGVGLTWGVLLLLPLVALVVVLALGVGLLLSALNVRYRDIRHALPFMIQIWMFASPVIYPLGMVPARWRWVLALNPMTGVIEGFRAALLGSGEVPWVALAISAAVALMLLICSLLAFRRLEKSFADEV